MQAPTKSSELCKAAAQEHYEGLLELPFHGADAQVAPVMCDQHSRKVCILDLYLLMAVCVMHPVRSAAGTDQGSNHVY